MSVFVVLDLRVNNNFNTFMQEVFWYINCKYNFLNKPFMGNSLNEKASRSFYCSRSLRCS